MNLLRTSPRRLAAFLFLLLAVLYNVNGRESGSIDTQPAKYLARSLAVGRAFTLDAEVAAQPELGTRASFVQGLDGHWRPGYGIVPGMIAAVPATVVHAIGLVDLEAPLAANLLAKLTASLLTAGAVTLVFLTLRRSVSTTVSLLTALGLGLGTNYWGSVSQTLGQHECVALGFALALWAWWRVEPLSPGRLAGGAIGLALAGCARMQVAPMIAVLLLWTVSRVGWRAALLPLAVVAAAAAAQVSVNVHWFGHPLGATLAAEALHQELHAVPGALAANPVLAAAGLLVSPSRGLLIYSPIVLIALVGIALSLRREARAPDLGWLGLAALLQFVLYATYAVWWGGHTFGPRYLLDVLIPLTPFGAIGVVWAGRQRSRVVVSSTLLAWSLGVAALGAWVYPNDHWNDSPLDVDRAHHRLWEVRDTQIARALHSSRSPKTFNLFRSASVRRTPS